MATVYVQFDSAAETTILTYFSGPQSATDWPNQGQVDTSDARWKTFYTAMQSANCEDGLPVPATS